MGANCSTSVVSSTRGTIRLRSTTLQGTSQSSRQSDCSGERNMLMWLPIDLTFSPMIKETNRQSLSMATFEEHTSTNKIRFISVGLETTQSMKLPESQTLSLLSLSSRREKERKQRRSEEL
jgi:hypothetical protein